MSHSYDSGSNMSTVAGDDGAAGFTFGTERAASFTLDQRLAAEPNQN